MSKILSYLTHTLISYIKKLWQIVYRIYGIRDNIAYGRNLHLGIGSILDSPYGLTIGDNVYIGKYCTIEISGAIGNYVIIANAVGIVGRYDHDYSCIGTPIRIAPWIKDESYCGEGTESNLIIEDDVWIGYGVIILSGVKIGKGAIIASGTVVANDVKQYSIVAGNPNHVIGKRFQSNEDIIEHERLLKTFIP